MSQGQRKPPLGIRFSPLQKSVYEALQILPTAARIKLAGLLITGVSPRDIVNSNDHRSEEDLRDAARSTSLLTKKRFGPETVVYPTPLGAKCGRG